LECGLKNRDFGGVGGVNHVYDEQCRMLLHWTSDLWSRSGYSDFQYSEPYSPFVISNRNASKKVTNFLLRYGQSYSPSWRADLQATLPTYHFEIAVTAGNKTSSFVSTSAQLDRVSFSVIIPRPTFPSVSYFAATLTENITLANYSHLDEKV
jgi:hypothetical protein